jgi:hypothetical protein
MCPLTYGQWWGKFFLKITMKIEHQEMCIENMSSCDMMNSLWKHQVHLEAILILLFHKYTS